jgi:hypothetical protein
MRSAWLRNNIKMAAVDWFPARNQNRRTTASCRGCDQTPFAVGGKGQASPDVVLGQLREVVEDLRMGLAGGEPTQHIRNRNPHVADARTTASLARLDGDDVLSQRFRTANNVGASQGSIKTGKAKFGRLLIATHGAARRSKAE